MSITQALEELKKLETKIQRQINQLKIVELCKGDSVVRGYKSNEEFMNKARADYQSVVALIKYRDDIKKAIVISNATTKVLIGKFPKEYTVAEAITKKHSIQTERELLQQIANNLQERQSVLTMNNTDMENKLQKILEANFSKEVKSNSSDIEVIRLPFIKANETKLVDPLKAEELIKTLSEDIEDFLSNVNCALTESNTLTKITVTI